MSANPVEEDISYCRNFRFFASLYLSKGPMKFNNFFFKFISWIMAIDIYMLGPEKCTPSSFFCGVKNSICLFLKRSHGSFSFHLYLYLAGDTTVSPDIY